MPEAAAQAGDQPHATGCTGLQGAWAGQGETSGGGRRGPHTPTPRARKHRWQVPPACSHFKRAGPAAARALRATTAHLLGVVNHEGVELLVRVVAEPKLACMAQRLLRHLGGAHVEGLLRGGAGGRRTQSAARCRELSACCSCRRARLRRLAHIATAGRKPAAPLHAALPPSAVPLSSNFYVFQVLQSLELQKKKAKTFRDASPALAHVDQDL